MLRVTIGLLFTLAIFSTNVFARHQAPIRCIRPNEEYHCGSACQATCSTLGQPCLIANIRCNDDCYCKEGYVRMDDGEGRCIPKDQCPIN
ncbi:hypothetical protein DMN91_008556 [Ooceraea biroi]|uniref:TIL domain-containing protein n=1 Tax=Ooceraea biroi TaxID=2015173 RepID=A0A3L8DCF9_OOCBI|nr:inducible metalloproteinase inhibitor protein [Ooceraea biroi]RLU18200.1 hypothetical protein DMN91_008556 [Ooceraea biroi]